MAERQAHGFRFEQKIKDILDVNEVKSYTSKWDIGDSISIKFISSRGTIDMGSVVRIFEALERGNWTMILGRHTDKVCDAVYELFFTEEICKKLMGDLTLQDVVEFDNAIKSFGPGKHNEARAYAKAWKEENKHKMGMLTIQPKIDSKNQRRVQCGINRTNLEKLFELETCSTFEKLVGENFG
jgi:hypothetical protein